MSCRSLKQPHTCADFANTRLDHVKRTVVALVVYTYPSLCADQGNLEQISLLFVLAAAVAKVQTMSRHVSKADEATSWRRSTALPSDHHSSKAGGYQHPPAHHHRSQSAEPTVHAARQHHHAAMQPLEPPKPMPATFSPDEAQQLLEKRWSEVTAQGLQPTCQCSSTSSKEEAAVAADGSSTGGDSSSKAGSSFLAALEAAVKINSADGAWDD